MWNNLKGRFYLGLLLLLFFLLLGLAGTAWGQETPKPSMSESLQTSESDGQSKSDTYSGLDQPVMQPQSELMQTWQQFKTEFQDFTLSLEEYFNQVEAFGINFEDLPLFLTFLTDSLSRSEAARLDEREAYQADREALQLESAHERAIRLDAEQSRDTWRTAAIVTGGITLAGVITGVLVIVLN